MAMPIFAARNRMFEMTKGNGFRVYPKEPRADAQGKTRGQRKRERRAAAIEKEVERQKAHRDLIVKFGVSIESASRQFGAL